MAQWYSELSGAIVGSQDTLPQPTDFTVSLRELVNTVRRDLSDEDGNATAAAFKIVWTDDYLRQLHEIEKRMIPVVQKIAAARDGSSRSSRRRPLKRRTAAAQLSAGRGLEVDADARAARASPAWERRDASRPGSARP